MSHKPNGKASDCNPDTLSSILRCDSKFDNRLALGYPVKIPSQSNSFVVTKCERE